MSTKKTSVALGREELAAARKAATREGLSLSAFLTRLLRDYVAQQARFEAMERYLEEYAPNFRATKEASAAVSAEWTAPLKPVRPRRRRTAA
jgi:hypothetical protein